MGKPLICPPLLAPCGVWLNVPSLRAAASATATVYAEEHSIVSKIEIVRAKFSGQGEDKTAFEAVSYWRSKGEDASQVS